MSRPNYWAENLLKSIESSVEDRIHEVYLRAFSREPNSGELQEALSFLENQAKGYKKSFEEMKDNPDLWKDYCHSVINLKEFIHLL